MDNDNEDNIIKQPISTPDIPETPKVIIAPSDISPKKLK